MKNNKYKPSPGFGGKRNNSGRPKGVSNKITTQLKDAILEAATRAGDKGGLVAYLEKQARADSCGPFVALLGKVLPLQVGNIDGETFKTDSITRIERVIVDNPSDRDK
jgi:hypothetical protein